MCLFALRFQLRAASSICFLELISCSKQYFMMPPYKWKIIYGFKKIKWTGAGFCSCKQKLFSDRCVVKQSTSHNQRSELEIQQIQRFNSQPEGLGVAFFATGPGWILKWYIFLTLEFPNHNHDFHLLTTSVNAKYYLSGRKDVLPGFT